MRNVAGSCSRKSPVWPKLAVLVRADGNDIVFEDVCAAARSGAEENGYRLNAQGSETVAFSVERLDGKEMDVDCLEVRFTVPMLNFSKVVLPDSGREYLFKDKALFLRSQVTHVSAPNNGHPFVALVDQLGTVVYSFGLVSCFRESTCRCTDPRLSDRNAMLGGHDLMTLSFRLPSEGWRYGRTPRIEETVYRGSDSPTWFHALRQYTRICRRHHRVEYPSSRRALLPTWCTWTAWCSDQLTEQSVLDNAQIARELGIKSVILDDGWFGPGLDTDDRPLNIGDYFPDPEKFRDLKALVGRLHKSEMDVLLWYAPTCISPDSRAFRQLADSTIECNSNRVLAPNGFYNLCPCNPAVRRHVRAEIVRMLQDYGVDGFKVDLYNTLPATPCDAEHEHDCESMIEGVHRMMRESWEELRLLRPRGVLELKQNYGNVLAARYGTMVRAGDTAYDIDTNLQRCAYIQAYAPVAHNDYLACSVHDDPVDLAVMMIKQITGGVPTFSMDLTKQPADSLNVIRAWLDFYRSRMPLWSRPRAPQDAHLNVWELGDRRTAILSAVCAATEVRVPEREEVIVFNGTGRDELYLRSGKDWTAKITCRDHLLRNLGTRRKRISDGQSVSVPVGGSVTLERE